MGDLRGGEPSLLHGAGGRLCAQRCGQDTVDACVRALHVDPRVRAGPAQAGVDLPFSHRVADRGDIRQCLVVDGEVCGFAGGVELVLTGAVDEDDGVVGRDDVGVA